MKGRNERWYILTGEYYLAVKWDPRHNTRATEKTSSHVGEARLARPPLSCFRFCAASRIDTSMETGTRSAVARRWAVARNRKIAKGFRASFSGDENALRLMLVTVTQVGKWTISHRTA